VIARPPAKAGWLAQGGRFSFVLGLVFQFLAAGGRNAGAGPSMVLCFTVMVALSKMEVETIHAYVAISPAVSCPGQVRSQDEANVEIAQMLK
jgi:hypothetical protein